MKIEKISLDGKKNSIEVHDSIIAAKVNKRLVSSLLYKINANYKGRKAKTKQKTKSLDRLQKYTLKKAQVTQGMRVEKHLYLLVVV